MRDRSKLPAKPLVRRLAIVTAAAVFGAAGYVLSAPGGGLFATAFLVWMGFCPAYFGVTGFWPPWKPE